MKNVSSKADQRKSQKSHESRAGHGRNSNYGIGKEWPAVVYLWMVGLAFMGYVTGRIVLSSQPHPYHWLMLLIGLIVGIPVGWIWFRLRGDIKF